MEYAMAFELMVEAMKYVMAIIAPKGVCMYSAMRPAIPKLIAFRYKHPFRSVLCKKGS